MSTALNLPKPAVRPIWLVAALGLIALGIGVWVLTRARPQPKTVELPVAARSSLLFSDGRWYELPQTNLFTGWMVEYFPDGGQCFRAAVSNGLLNGVSEGWYTNGQIQIREFYKDSIADGPRQKWHENGQLKSEATIVAGQVEGEFQSWHENGQLAERIQMRHGVPDGEAWGFYASGFARAKTSAHAGQILAQTTWADGEHRPTLAANPLASESP
jgi:hypothetical protein